MYCGCNLNIKGCKCNKTVKPSKANRTTQIPYAFGRIFSDKLIFSKKNFIQTQNTLYSYNSNLEKKFNFTLCSTCNSAFQRLSATEATIPSQNKNTIIIDDDSIGSFTAVDSTFDSTFHTNEFIDIQDDQQYDGQEKQKVSFTFIIKKADGKSLPEKWLIFENVSTFEKFATQIRKCVETMMDIDNINQEEYFLTFKPAKSSGEGLELSESKDFKKFLNEYERLFRVKKEIIVIANIKKKVNKKKKKKKK
jgi:hypothetical protein